jgi:hypothetical protein
MEAPTPSNALRATIVARLRAGTLPRIFGPRAVAGVTGEAKPCLVCQQTIAPWIPRYDLEPGAAHARCFLLWLEESSVSE